MTMLMLQHLNLLLCSLALAVRHVSSQCMIGCNDSSIQGFPTLADLQCAMQQEVNFVNAGIPIRDSPPYLYVLCPNTSYTISSSSSSQDAIIPLLNDTIIACGDSNFAERGSCRIAAPVNLVNDLPHVEFRDLTFTGGDFRTSVSALASADSSATFHRCHWVNRTWAIENLNPTVIGAPVMQIDLNDCTMTDTDTSVDEGFETFGIRTYGGSISINNLTVTNYNVSTFLDIRDTAFVSLQGAVFEASTLKDPQGFQDFIFVHNSSTLTLDSVQVTGSAFANFVWLQGGAFVQANRCSFYNNRDGFGSIFRLTSTAAGLTIKNSDLSGLGFSLISASGNGPELLVEQSTFGMNMSNHAIWSFTDLVLEHSCFSGTTIYPPIFVSESQASIVDVFSDVEVLASNCTGLFVEETGDECFYPDDTNPDAICDGQCIALDAETCSTTRYPPAPTCNLEGCPIVPPIGRCAKTLKELRCTMCGEAKAIVDGSILRRPPYTYSLCSDTLFPITNETEDAIFPILNGTQILCGMDGLLANNCTVDSGVLQVEIGQSSRDPTDSLVSPLPLEHVEIRGIAFANGDFAQFGISASIWARAPPNVVAVMKDCTWSGSTGSHVLVNLNLDESLEQIVPTMHVNFDTCSFQDIIAPGSHVGIMSVSGRVTMSNVVVQDYAMGSSFADFVDSLASISQTIFINCEAQDSMITSQTGSQVQLTQVSVKESSYHAFLAASSGGTAIINDTMFTANEGIVDVLAEGSSSMEDVMTEITVHNCTFEESSVERRVIASSATINVLSSLFFKIEAESGIEALEASRLQLRDVCFLDGDYMYPVLVNNSDVSFSNVFGDDVQASSGCTGLTLIGTTSGDFNESCAPFDASSCSLIPLDPTQAPTSAPTPPPTPAPTPSTTPTSSTGPPSTFAVAFGFALVALFLV